QAIGGGAHGQSVRRVRNKEGDVAELWFAGSKLLPEAEVAREIRERYENNAMQGSQPRRLRLASRR
ncbi:MAG: hypothetical protein JOY67_17850, partial [Hyphomicrobiales bacterium]|nr:hypothetical protein [Hyphomicrobiales bacterium]